MGVGIHVGNPWLGDDEGEARYPELMRELRDALAAENVSWEPPATPPPYGMARRHVGGFPYSNLRYLHRAYALYYENQPVTPATGRPDLDSAQRYVDDATSMLSSHLLCHSVYGGYYVPVPLCEPLFLPSELGIAGDGMVGSSQGLLAELRQVAPTIGVRLGADGDLSDDEAARLYGNTDGPYGTEQMVWLALHEACRMSIASGHPIVFS